MEEQMQMNAKAMINKLKLALEVNRKYQATLHTQLNKVEAAQQNNRMLQRKLKIILMGRKSAEDDSIDSTNGKVKSTKPINSKKYMNIMQKRPASRYFFQDKSGNYPPPNTDTLQKRVHQEKMPLVYKNRKWTPADIKNLKAGVRQQLQQRMMAKVMTRFQNDNRPDARERLHVECEKIEKMTDEQLEMSEYKNDPDVMVNLQRIYKEIEENGSNREDLLHINWEAISQDFLPNRTPAEIKKYWLSFLSCKVKTDNWTRDEDRLLLSLAQQYKGHNWIEIAKGLHETKLQNPNSENDGTYRTPLHCFRRYQRSLNVNMMRSKWTEEEDEMLKKAVEQFGERNWQQVANCLEGRAGQQCLHRWMKTLSPHIKRGRWTIEEDKRLIMGVHAYGKSWITIHEHIPGRTDVQCRERWCNILDPEINAGPWTPEEDERLRRAIAEYGLGKWSKIAEICKPRTDNQCWRRWKVLNSEKEVKEYKKNLMKRQNGLVRNFVGREKERSLLTEDDFELHMDSDQEEGDVEEMDEEQQETSKKKRGPKKGSTRGPIRRTKGHSYQNPVHLYVKSIISYPVTKSLLPFLKIELYRQKLFDELQHSKPMLVGIQPSSFVYKSISLLQLSYSPTQVAVDKDTKYAFVDPIIVTPHLLELPCVGASRVTISALAKLHNFVFSEEEREAAQTTNTNQSSQNLLVNSSGTTVEFEQVEGNLVERNKIEPRKEKSIRDSSDNLTQEQRLSAIQKRINPKFGVNELKHMDPEILKTDEFKMLTSVFNSLFQHSFHRVMLSTSNIQKPQRIVTPDLTAHMQHLVPKKDKQGTALARQCVGLYYIYKENPEPFEKLFNSEKNEQPLNPANGSTKKRGRPRKNPISSGLADSTKGEPSRKKQKSIQEPVSLEPGVDAMEDEPVSDAVPDGNGNAEDIDKPIAQRRARRAATRLNASS
jgi:hypothetical protein